MIKRAKKIFAYSMIGVLLALPMANTADALTNKTTNYKYSYNNYSNKNYNKRYKKSNKTTAKKPTTTTTSQQVQSQVPAPTTKPINTTTNTNTTASTSSSFGSYQQEVLNLVNKERTSRGLSALKFNSELSKVATTKSQDMINKGYFDHNSPTYGSPFDMMRQFGISYRTAGENIAMGQKTPQEVMTAWMNSDGHRKNILNSSFTELGVGIAKDSNGRLYWTQMFIGK